MRGALLRTQSLCIWQPNLQHVAARAGFVDKAKRGMASLYLSTPKGQTVAFTLCTNAASALAIPVCNLLVSRNFYDDYDFCLLTDSFYLEAILVSMDRETEDEGSVSGFSHSDETSPGS